MIALRHCMMGELLFGRAVDGHVALHRHGSDGLQRQQLTERHGELAVSGRRGFVLPLFQVCTAQSLVDHPEGYAGMAKPCTDGGDGLQGGADIGRARTIGIPSNGCKPHHLSDIQGLHRLDAGRCRTGNGPKHRHTVDVFRRHAGISHGRLGGLNGELPGVQPSAATGGGVAHTHRCYPRGLSHV